MTDSVTVPPLPAPLSWDVAPATWNFDGALTIAAPPRTDLFRDPAGSEPQTAAPRLLGPVEGDFQLSARVQLHLRGCVRRRRAAAVGGRGALGEARARELARR